MDDTLTPDTADAGAPAVQDAPAAQESSAGAAADTASGSANAGLTDVHHDWVADALGVDPRDVAAPADAAPAPSTAASLLGAATNLLSSIPPPPSLSEIGEFGVGVIRGVEDALTPLGVGGMQPTPMDNSKPFAIGRSLGQIGAGLAEMAAGAGEEIGGVALDLTGVGAIVGVPVNVLGAAVIVQGGASAIIGAANLGHAMTMSGDSGGGGGGGGGETSPADPPSGTTPETPPEQPPPENPALAPETPAAPAQGRVTGDVSSLEPQEQRVVQDLTAQGHDVEIVPATSTQRTPDFKVDGVPTELKTVSGVKNISDDGLSKALSNRIMNGRGQAPNVVVDARDQPGMTKAIAERGMRRAFGADNATAGKAGRPPGLQTITIITPEGEVTLGRQ